MFAKCSFPLCWEAQCGKTEFCNLHNKVNRNWALDLYQQIFTKIGNKDWPTFITSKLTPFLKDNSLIFENDLKNILASYSIRFTDDDYKCLYRAFPGRHEGSFKSINISSLLSLQQQAYDDSKVYENIELSDEEDKQFFDASGYTGVQHRIKIFLEPITMEELV